MIKKFKNLIADAPTLVNAREGYDLWSSHYDDEKNPVRTLSIESLNKLMPNVTHACVLDIGCGTGYFGREVLKQHPQKVIGMDLSLAMIAKAHTLAAGKGFSFIRADAEYLPFSDHSFDLIVCSLVMAHLPEIGPAIGEMARVLRADGNILISDFHPFGTLLGAKRTFRDPVTRRLFEIAHSVHFFESYITCLSENKLVLDGFIERLYKEVPLVFAMKIKKL